jgi:iron complex outermembrane receptor protein
VDLVDGERSSDDEPLPLIPPLRGVVGLEGAWNHLSWADRFHAGLEVEMVEEKDRAADNEIATAGYALLHGDVGLERTFWGRAWDFSFRGRNLGNASYRDFLSRYKAFALNPGRNLVFKVETNF